MVTVRFDVENFSPFNSWNRTRMDNIVVATRADFEAHRGPVPAYEGCYSDTLPGWPNTGENAPAFYFDTFALTHYPLADLFDTDPTGDPARPWDMTHGAYFIPQGLVSTCDSPFDPDLVSAPRVPSTGSDCTGGALGMGLEAEGPGLVTTEIPVTGLVPGTEYIVTGWWATNTLTAPLTVTVFVPGVGADVRLVALDDLSQSNGVDDLVRIPDVSTGVGQYVGSLGNGFRNTEALTVQGLGTPQERLLAVDDARLLEIDAATGAGTLIGPVGFDGISGIAFHPVTDVLYGVTHGSNLLLRIDTTTGAGTVVAANVIAGHRLQDIAFHPDGRAFVLAGSNPKLYTIDLTTGAWLQMWTLSGAASLESLCWSPDGSTLYSAADRGGWKDLVRIDLGTSSVTFVGPLHSGAGDIEALTWVSPATDRLLATWDLPSSVAPSRRGLQLVASPNPFNPTVRIDYELPAAAPVRLDVFDVAGRRVAVLRDADQPAGAHAAVWNGRSTAGAAVPSGIYIVRLEAAGDRASVRIVLAR
jgi:hypothetical protein